MFLINYSCFLKCLVNLFILFYFKKTWLTIVILAVVQGLEHRMDSDRPCPKLSVDNTGGADHMPTEPTISKSPISLQLPLP